MHAMRDELTHVFGARPGSAPRVTVLATNTEETLAALKSAEVLAQGIGAHITLLKVELLPRHYPLEKCQPQFDFLETRARALLVQSGIHSGNISVQVWLCRDEKKCLRRALASHSLIVIGTKWRWWPNHGRRLQKWLAHLGHYVIPVDVKAKNSIEMVPKSYGDSFLCHEVKNLGISPAAR